MADIDKGQEATDGELKLDTVEIIKQLKSESRRARMPREMEWNKSWNLYNGAYDFSRKAEWQSKNSIPRVNTSVRSAANLLKKGLVVGNDYYDTQGYGEVGKAIAPYVHKLTKFHARSGNFAGNYTSAVIAGLLNSLVCLKVYPKIVEGQDWTMSWNRAGPTPPQNAINASMVGDVLAVNHSYAKKKKRLTVRYDPISAYDLFPDPYGEGLYVIHEIDMDLFEFRAMAYKHRDVFDIRAVDGIFEQFASFDKQVQEANRKVEEVPTQAPFRKRIRVDEFWGHLIDDRGNVLFRNAYAMSVNEKALVVRPRPNKLPTGRHPFIMEPIIERPFSTWHQSFTESVNGIQVMLTELVNMMLDGNLANSIKAYELDIDQVYDPNEFVGGIFPGKTYKKRGSAAGSMIKDVSVGNLNPQNLDIFSMLDREFQSGTMLNEFLTPQMRVRAGRVTATEAMKKGQDSADMFGEIARGQEDRVIVPALEMTYAYILQYQRDFSDPLLVELMGEQDVTRAQIFLNNPNLRDFLKSAPVKFQAFGMSRLMGRMRDVEKVMTFIQLIGNVSKAIPGIISMINFKELLEMTVLAMQWDIEKVLNKGAAPLQPPVGNDQPGMPPPQGGGLPDPMQAMAGNDGAAAIPPVM